MTSVASLVTAAVSAPVNRRVATPGKGVGAFPQTTAILGAGGLDYALYDSGFMSSLFQDAAGATPVTATGQSVGRQNVRQKPPHYASQPTAGQRPVLETAGLKFDGSDDNLLSDWIAQAGANCIIAQIAVPATLSATQVIAGVQEPSNDGLYLGITTGGLLRAKVGGGLKDGTTDLRGQSILVAVGTNGASLELFAGAISEGTGVVLSSFPTASPLRLGALNVNGVPAACSAGHIKRVAFGKIALTLTQFQTIRAEWLAAA